LLYYILSTEFYNPETTPPSAYGLVAQPIGGPFGYNIGPSYNTDFQAVKARKATPPHTPFATDDAPHATDDYTSWEIPLPTGLLPPISFPSQAGYTTTLIDK